MTVVEGLVPARASELSAVNPRISLRLSAEDVIAIVERNHECVIRHELDGGPVRVHRLPYAWNDGAMVLPSWTGIDGSLRADLTMVECYVNELEPATSWRIVLVRGRPSLFLPTGGARERAQWRTNLEALRLEVRDLAPPEILALENYGVVRLKPDELSGSAVRVDD